MYVSLWEGARVVNLEICSKKNMNDAERTPHANHTPCRKSQETWIGALPKVMHVAYYHLGNFGIRIFI